MEKVYISTKEGVWNEIVSANITEEENLIIDSEDTNLKAKKFELLKAIKNRQIKELNKEDLVIVIKNYNNIKNVLNILKDDNYILISITILVIDDTSYSGILNYIINNKHEQLRF